jgi:hypothetical protein
MLNRLRFSALSVLAVTLLFSACEKADRITSPLSPTGDREEEVFTYTGDHGFKVVLESDPKVGAVTAVIDQNGGALAIGGTVLFVPKGAVSAPTTFTMTKPNGTLKYDFTATQDTPNDVGSAGFPVPLTLMIDYSGVKHGMKNPVVLWFRPDGYAVPLPTTVNRSRKTMSAQIHHFSIYGGADTLLGFVFGLL